MLDLAIIEAILNIPGALQSSRDLLASRKPNVGAVLIHLDVVRERLIEFSNVGSWFGEMKELHQNLQSVQIALGPADRWYERATVAGFFDPQEYSLGTARESWETAKQSLNRLMGSLGAMRYVRDLAPWTTEMGTIRRIPRWGLITIRLKAHVDGAFARIDSHPPGSDDELRTVAVGLKDLSDHIKEQMMEADREFRDRATAMSRALETLARDLKNG